MRCTPRNKCTTNTLQTHFLSIHPEAFGSLSERSHSLEFTEESQRRRRRASTWVFQKKITYLYLYIIMESPN